MTEELNNFFAKVSTERKQKQEDGLEKFNVLMREVTEEINSIDLDAYSILKNTNNLLFNFEKEHPNLPSELKMQLSNNLNERIEYTTKLLSGFHKKLSQINKGNQKMANQLRKDLERWRKKKD